jgi:hypothetical protein
MHSRRNGFLAAHRERLFGNSNWDKRRRVIYLALLYCAVLVCYIVFKGADTALNAQVSIALIGLAGAIIGSYCFAAVWDDNNKRDAAVAVETSDEESDPPTSLLTDRD